MSLWVWVSICVCVNFGVNVNKNVNMCSCVSELMSHRWKPWRGAAEKQNNEFPLMSVPWLIEQCGKAPVRVTVSSWACKPLGLVQTPKQSFFHPSLLSLGKRTKMVISSHGKRTEWRQDFSHRCLVTPCADWGPTHLRRVGRSMPKWAFWRKNNHIRSMNAILWVEHTSLRPNVSIPCTSFLRIKLLNIKYLLSLSACVCEHSLVVPFSSPPLCGCRPKTAVRGIRGTIHQLPVNTKYICCILHHQYINTEYINTKYARCILGPPSLILLSITIGNRQLHPWSLHKDVVKPSETGSASFSIFFYHGPSPHNYFHYDVT